MKKIETIIRPTVFESVRQALALEGIDGLTVTEIAGIGKQEGRIGMFRGHPYKMAFSVRLKLDMVVEYANVEAIIAAILEYAGTGEVGDVKTFI